MKFEQKDKSMLFSRTELPDIFFTEYLTFANSDSIKVYLCLIFLSKYNKEIKLNDLSKKLNLHVNVIQASLSFWEEQGVLTKKLTGYILNDLQEIELHKSYSPNLTLTPEKIEKNEKSKYRAKAIESINNRCFQGIMSPSWYSYIDLWFEKYEFDEQVMIALFDYCNNKSALHKNYVQTVAEAWNKSNIKSYDDLERYYEKYEKIKVVKTAIAKKLRRYTPLTEFEEALIEKWFVDYNYNMDIINIALKRTTSKVTPSFDYVDKLLSSWHNKNLKTPNEIETFIAQFNQKNTKSKEIAKQTNYNNYNQRTYENLDDFYANKKQ